LKKKQIFWGESMREMGDRSVIKYERFIEGGLRPILAADVGRGSKELDKKTNPARRILLKTK